MKGVSSLAGRRYTRTAVAVAFAAGHFFRQKFVKRPQNVQKVGDFGVHRERLNDFFQLLDIEDHRLLSADLSHLLPGVPFVPVDNVIEWRLLRRVRPFGGLLEERVKGKLKLVGRLKGT